MRSAKTGGKSVHAAAKAGNTAVATSRSAPLAGASTGSCTEATQVSRGGESANSRSGCAMGSRRACRAQSASSEANMGVFPSRVSSNRRVCVLCLVNLITGRRFDPRRGLYEYRWAFHRKIGQQIQERTAFSSQVKSSRAVAVTSQLAQLVKLNLKALFPGIIRYHAQFRGRGTAHSLVERVCTAGCQSTHLSMETMHFSRLRPGSLLILCGLRSGSGSRARARRRRQDRYTPRPTMFS